MTNEEEWMQVLENTDISTNETPRIITDYLSDNKGNG